MYDITPESNLMVLRIKNNDPQLKKLLFFFFNYPFQLLRKSIEHSMENMYRVLGCKGLI